MSRLGPLTDPEIALLRSIIAENPGMEVAGIIKAFAAREGRWISVKTVQRWRDNPNRMPCPHARPELTEAEIAERAGDIRRANIEAMVLAGGDPVFQPREPRRATYAGHGPRRLMKHEY